MNFYLIWIMLGVCAYLFGAVPYGYLIAKARGVDIRTVGSKNIGATNVFRTVGKCAGIAAFALDMGKGWFATFMLPNFLLHVLGLCDKEVVNDFCHRLIEATTPALAEGILMVSFKCTLLPLYVFCGVCAVIGHNWTCFLGFKGGKGVATSLGFILALAPLEALIALLVWVVVLLVTRYVSVASIMAAAALGIVIWRVYPPYPVWFPCVISALALLAIIKHHANIRRLLNGTEKRIFGSKK